MYHISPVYYKSPPIFPKMKEEVAYNPLLDETILPDVLFEGSTWAHVFEVSHRALASSRSGCYMRAVAARIYGLLFDILWRGREDRMDLLELAGSYNKFLSDLHASTLYVQEIFSLWFTIYVMNFTVKHNPKYDVSFNKSDIDKYERQTLDYYEKTQKLLAFGKLYYRFKRACDRIPYLLVLPVYALNVPVILRNIQHEKNKSFADYLCEIGMIYRRSVISPTERLKHILRVIEDCPYVGSRNWSTEEFYDLLRKNLSDFDWRCGRSQDCIFLHLLGSADFNRNSLGWEWTESLSDFLCKEQTNAGIKKLQDQVTTLFYGVSIRLSNDRLFGIRDSTPVPISNYLFFFHLLESFRVQLLEIRQGLSCPWKEYRYTRTITTFCSNCQWGCFFLDEIWKRGQSFIEKFMDRWDKPPCPQKNVARPHDFEEQISKIFY